MKNLEYVELALVDGGFVELGDIHYSNGGWHGKLFYINEEREAIGACGAFLGATRPTAKKWRKIKKKLRNT